MHIYNVARYIKHHGHLLLYLFGSVVLDYPNIVSNRQIQYYFEQNGTRLRTTTTQKRTTQIEAPT